MNETAKQNNTTEKPAVPEGYMENAKGSFVPVSKVKLIDRERDDLVTVMIERAKALQEQIREFKKYAFEDVAAFIAMSLEEHGVEVGGEKGNASLVSYNGRFKVQRAYGDILDADETVMAAKVLLDECFSEWSVGADENLRVIVNDTFEVDQKGNLNINKLLTLRRYNIDHPKWKKAMDIIGDSLFAVMTKGYIRFYAKEDIESKWVPISLDIAAV